MIRLGRLLVEHPAACAHDWRTRYGCSAQGVGEPGGMSWVEACLLLRVLVTDTSSRVCAAVNGWPAPMSSEVDALLSVHDVVVSALSRKAHRSPRPWDNPAAGDTVRVQHRARSGLPQAVVLDVLDAMRHGRPHPLLAPAAEPHVDI